MNRVEVIGYIWQPGIPICAMTYPLSRHDIENIEEGYPNCEPGINRDNIEQWLMSHSGDFQDVVDFRAFIDDLEFEFDDEMNRFKWYDCMSED